MAEVVAFAAALTVGATSLMSGVGAHLPRLSLLQQMNAAALAFTTSYGIVSSAGR